MKLFNSKVRAGDRVFGLVNGFVMILFAIVMVYPLWYVFVASFTEYGELMRSGGFLFWPKEPTIEAYKMAFKNPLIVTGYLNTIFVVLVGTVVSLALTALGAYFLTREDVKLKKPISILIIITMYFSGGMIPFYFTVTDLGLENSLWALILPVAINTFNLIIMRTSFEGIPRSIEESAEIEGAGHWSILFRIMLPLSGSTLAVIGLYYGVSYWNSWFHAMLFIKERELFPLQLVLREILMQNDTSQMVGGADFGENSQMSEAVKYAVIIIATLPILCVYPFLQKYFVKGVMVGAVKG